MSSFKLMIHPPQLPEICSSHTFPSSVSENCILPKSWGHRASFLSYTSPNPQANLVDTTSTVAQATMIPQDYGNRLLHVADTFAPHATICQPSRLQHTSGEQLQSPYQCPTSSIPCSLKVFCSTVSVCLLQQPQSAKEELLPSRATFNQLGQGSVDTCTSSPPLERESGREEREKEWGNNFANWTPAYNPCSPTVYSPNLSQSMLLPCLKPSSSSSQPSG